MRIHEDAVERSVCFGISRPSRINQSISETELETKIIDHLQKFLLELGTGFAFIGRQVTFHI